MVDPVIEGTDTSRLLLLAIGFLESGGYSSCNNLRAKELEM